MKSTRDYFRHSARSIYEMRSFSERERDVPGRPTRAEPNRTRVAARGDSLIVPLSISPSVSPAVSASRPSVSCPGNRPTIPTPPATVRGDRIPGYVLQLGARLAHVLYSDDVSGGGATGPSSSPSPRAIIIVPSPRRASAAHGAARGRAIEQRGRAYPGGFGAEKSSQVTHASRSE